jgi:hypothetical protein
MTDLCIVPPFLLPSKLLAPCFFDPLFAFLVLILACFSLFTVPFFDRLLSFNVTSNARQLPPSEETQPLLQQTNDASPNRKFRSHPIRHSASLIARTSSALITLTYLLVLVLDTRNILSSSTNGYPTSQIPLRNPTQARLLSDVLSTFSWVSGTTVLLVEKRAKSSLLTFWLGSSLLESVQVYQWVIVLLHEDIQRVGLDLEDTLFLIAYVIRWVSITMLFGLSVYYCQRGSNKDAGGMTSADAEAGGGTSNGASVSQSPPPTGTKSSWSVASKNFRKAIPYVWPKGPELQLTVLGCFGLLILGRLVNIFVPFQYKMVIDKLTEGGSMNDSSPPDQYSKALYGVWGAILLFCLLRYLQGGVGIISTLQGLLWIPIKQYNDRQISVKLLEHLHSLSLQFHVNRKTGEVLRTMDRGTNSIGSLLNTMLFNIIPVFVDIGIAVIWFIMLVSCRQNDV